MWMHIFTTALALAFVLVVLVLFLLVVVLWRHSNHLRKAYITARAKGVSEGLAIGRAAGHAFGHFEGSLEGYAQGHADGRSEGFEHGVTVGIDISSLFGGGFVVLKAIFPHAEDGDESTAHWTEEQVDLQRQRVSLEEAYEDEEALFGFDAAKSGLDTDDAGRFVEAKYD